MRRILSLDGGGIKGTFTAAFLAALEKQTGKSISEYFDLIVGTSTGGIIAIGLGLGLRATQITDFYKTRGPIIFPDRSWAKWSGYNPNTLKSELIAVFGARKLGESKNRLVIPSFDLDLAKAYFYKTSHHERLRDDYLKEAVEAAMATSSAPWYFPAYITPSGTPQIDGGIWANNPILVGILEAIAVLKWPAEELAVLSVGTTAPIADTRCWKNRFRWLYGPFVADAIISTQMATAMESARLLLGEDRVFRFSPVVPPGRYSLDKASEVSSLISLAEDQARTHYAKLSKVFFSSTVDPFVPAHAL